MRFNRKAFTIIELMIVVTIIAILASIAVPSMLRARMSANEVAAIGGLRSIVESQAVYKRTDWDDDGKYEFAFPFYELCEMSSGKKPALIDVSIARAWRASDPIVGVPGTPASPFGYLPKGGYIFSDNTYYKVGSTWQQSLSPWLATGNLTNRYGAHASPESYFMTGVNSYAADDKGVIWQKNYGADTISSEDYSIDSPALMAAAGWRVTE